jgi:hypothetical protein
MTARNKVCTERDNDLGGQFGVFGFGGVADVL